MLYSSMDKRDIDRIEEIGNQLRETGGALRLIWNQEITVVANELLAISQRLRKVPRNNPRDLSCSWVKKGGRG